VLLIQCFSSTREALFPSDNSVWVGLSVASSVYPIEHLPNT
jgi:hypothetical protein